MKVLMIGVDDTHAGGMLTVVKNYLECREFCEKTNLTYIATATRGTALQRIAFFLGALGKTALALYRERPDVVHIHMAERGSVARKGIVAFLAHRAGAKVVIHMHAATLEVWYRRQGRLGRRLIGLCLGQADRMILLGEFMVPMMEEILGPKKDRIRVLYNSVQAPEENPYRADRTGILFYGTLIRRKGIEDLLEAFRRILPEIPEDVHLILCGDDAEHRIGELIRRCGLEGRAQYRGWMSREKQAACFSEAMIHVLPSYHEGLPMAVLETMGYGIPNITTRVAAIPEVVEDGVNGILLRPGDVDGLAANLRDLIGDAPRRMRLSREAHRTIRGGFSFPAHIERLLSIYGELMKEQAGRHGGRRTADGRKA